MNKIVVELHPEDRARLDAIIRGLAALAPGSMSDAAEALAQMPWPRPSAVADDFPVEGTAHLEPVDAPAPAPAAEPAPVEPSPEPMSLGEFQKAVTTWLAGNPAKKPQARELVNRYASSATEIPPEKRAEFLALLSAL